MSTARLLIGDVFDRMAEIPDGSIDLVLTSPPFLALRSYLPADHPDKAKEIGSEPTPAEFLDTLLALTAEWRRVLAPHGSICVELGDTYAGSGGAGGDYNEGGLRDGQAAFDGAAARHRASGRRPTRKPRTSSAAILGGDPDEATVAAPPDRLRTRRQLPGWPMAKSMCGIPHLYHLSLAYGMNLLTGEESPAGCWRVRNVVAWCRPNPSPGAVGQVQAGHVLHDDRHGGFRSLLRWVRRAGAGYPNTNARTARGVAAKQNTTKAADDPRTGGNRSTLATIYTSGDTRPAYDWWDLDSFEADAWEIATRPYAGSH